MIFPESSRHVFIGTNTIPMYKALPRLRGLGKDIFTVQSQEEVDSHYIYENSQLTQGTLDRLNEFINLYDGVHVLVSDRTRITKEFIPMRPFDRDDLKAASDYSPVHYHHNWRFKTEEKTA